MDLEDHQAKGKEYMYMSLHKIPKACFQLDGKDWNAESAQNQRQTATHSMFFRMTTSDSHWTTSKKSNTTPIMIGHLGHPSIGHPNNQHEVYDFHSLGKV